MRQEKKTALIFPPLGLSRRMLERVSYFFGPTPVCLPWHMENPLEAEEMEDPSTHVVLYPPTELKPPEDFPKLLKEYRVWMNDHYGRSVLAPLSALNDMNNQKESHWEIRKMIRKGTQIDSLEQKKHEALRWHLILSLAVRLEKEQADAQNALRRSQAQGSPLKEALGTSADLPDMPGDLFPLPPPHTFVENDLWGNVCEAWLGLFRCLLDESSVLITFKKDIRLFLTALFEEAASRHILAGKLSRVCFDIGDPLLHGTRNTITSGSAGLKHRAMILFDDLETRLMENQGNDTKGIDAVVHSLQQMFPPENVSASLHVEMFFLPSIERRNLFPKELILHGLSGKILAFLRENANNG